jgi:hypothetical protein
MLVEYIKDIPICYDGMTRTDEKVGNIVQVEDNLAKALVKSERVKVFKRPEEKMVEPYEDKMIKTYENKSVKRRGRPKTKNKR